MNNIYMPLILAPPNNADIMIDLILKHPDQQRDGLAFCDCLNHSAGEKANMILTTGHVHHVINGLYPNKLVRMFCKNLDPAYEDDHNYVESIVYGLSDPNQALQALLNSSHHKPHILGSNDFYRQQTNIGVAYGNYLYVIHIAKLI